MVQNTDRLVIEVGEVASKIEDPRASIELSAGLSYPK
jgi:hypothetical protein